MIRISNLTVGYRNKAVINRLSFQADPSCSPVVLAGRNGSGKTSIFRAILGQVPYEGTIEKEAGKEKIAWLPQQYTPPLHVPVLDFVAMGSVETHSILPTLASDAKARALRALDKLGISHLSHKPTDELSGGEWQLVCLAQMHAQDVDVWLLDEPTSSLDIGYKIKVFELIWEEARKGKTILLSTHDLPFLPKDQGSFLFLRQEPLFLPNDPESKEFMLDELKTMI